MLELVTQLNILTNHKYTRMRFVFVRMIGLNAMLLFCRYGVGMIYYKQEKFSLAEMHYRKALAINPQSSVLLCHIGVVSSTFPSLFLFVFPR